MVDSKSWWRKTNATELGFMSVTFFTGLAVAFLVPVFSLFLTDEIRVRPMLVGMFFTANAVVGVIIGQILAYVSDQMPERKRLIILCGIAGIFGGILYAFDRHYWILISLGVLLMSLCGAMTPQLYALAREYTDAQHKQAVTFSTVMRAQFSLAWVFGPPLAFFILAHFDYTRLFLGVAVLYLLCVVIIIRLLPNLRRQPRAKTVAQVSIWQNRPLLLLSLGTFFLWTCNSMYLMTMPLYVTNQLHWQENLVGWLMGTAAGLEIPVMLIAGRFSVRVGNHRLMVLSALAAVCFYLLLLVIQQPVFLFGAQALNALFIGISAGIGITYFQDLLPGYAGQATTLFTNCLRCGGIVAGMTAGAILELFHYQGVFVCSVVLSCLALGAMSLVRHPQVFNPPESNAKTDSGSVSATHSGQ